MRRSTRFPILAAVFLALSAVGARAAPDTDGAAALRSVTVSGHGEVQAIPDVAELRLGVTERGQDLDALRGRVAATVARFLALCDELAIPRDAVRTASLAVQPRYRWDEEDARRILTGYEVSRQLEVRLRDLALLGPVLERSVSLGVNQVSAPQLDLVDRPAREREALAIAAADALARAETLAGALGASVGPVRRIDATRTAVAPPFARAEMRLADDGGQTYRTGTVSISADVTVVFALSPPPAP